MRKEGDRLIIVPAPTKSLLQWPPQNHVLGFLFFRSWRSSTQIQVFWKSSWAIYSLLMSMTMAFFDEFHQSFVPSRSPSLRDVALDATGALFSMVLIRTWAATRVCISDKAL